MIPELLKQEIRGTEWKEMKNAQGGSWGIYRERGPWKMDLIYSNSIVIFVTLDQVFQTSIVISGKMSYQNLLIIADCSFDILTF